MEQKRKQHSTNVGTNIVVKQSFHPFSFNTTNTGAMKLQKGQNHKILIILIQVSEKNTNYATIKKKLLFTKNASRLLELLQLHL